MGVARVSRTIVKPQSVYLKPEERVAKILPDYHVRKQQGQLWGYVVEDKQQEWCILSQKLQLICDHINTLVKDRPDKVSLTGLYDILSVLDDNPRSRTGAYSKHRWKVRRFTLDELANAFEETRGKGFQHSIVLASTSIVNTQPVMV